MSSSTVHPLRPSADHAPQHSLNPRQELFCARIAGGASGAEAARAAGYSRESAAQQASRLLRQPAIRAEIARNQADDDLAQRAAMDRALAKAEEVYTYAIRERQCSAAVRAILLEAALRSGGAGKLPKGADTAAFELEMAEIAALNPPRPF